MNNPDRPGRPAPGTPDLFAKQPYPPDRAPEPQAGPAWLVVPVRVVALIVVVPFQLLYQLLKAIGRGIAAAWRFLIRIPVAIAVALYRWVLRPLGIALWWPLRKLGAAIAVIAVWLYRYVLSPIGRFLDLVLLGPLRALGRGLAWLCARAGRALALLFRGIGVLLTWIFILPAVFLWRYLLLPPLRALAWLARGAGRAIAAAWRGFAAAVAWTWRTLVVAPLAALWRHVLVPVGAGIAWAWRLTARILSWLWRTLIVAPVRVLIVIPLRWFGRNVLAPIGRGIGAAWRVTVRDPLRAVRRTLREAGRDVRRTLRRTFLGR